MINDNYFIFSELIICVIYNIFIEFLTYTFVHAILCMLNIQFEFSVSENVVPRKWSHRSASPSPSTDTSPSSNQEHFTFADPREGSRVAPSASNKGTSKGTSKFKSAFGSFKNMKLLKKNSTDIVEESGNISCAKCREVSVIEVKVTFECNGGRLLLCREVSVIEEGYFCL